MLSLGYPNQVGGHGHGTGTDDSFGIVRRRYSQGEITKEEFEDITARLK